MIDSFQISPDAKSLTINLAMIGEMIEAIDKDTSDDLIARFTVHARPVPWKVSIRRAGKGPPTNPSFAAWKRSVASAARLAMGGRGPFAGDVEVFATFHLTRRAGPPPDLTNLLKGTEDGLQGIVIANDRRVVAIAGERIIGGRNEAEIEVRRARGSNE